MQCESRLLSSLNLLAAYMLSFNLVRIFEDSDRRSGMLDVMLFVFKATALFSFSNIFMSTERSQQHGIGNNSIVNYLQVCANLCSLRCSMLRHVLITEAK